MSLEPFLNTVPPSWTACSEYHHIASLIKGLWNVRFVSYGIKWYHVHILCCHWHQVYLFLEDNYVELMKNKEPLLYEDVTKVVSALYRTVPHCTHILSPSLSPSLSHCHYPVTYAMEVTSLMHKNVKKGSQWNRTSVALYTQSTQYCIALFLHLKRREYDCVPFEPLVIDIDLQLKVALLWKRP